MKSSLRVDPSTPGQPGTPAGSSVSRRTLFAGVGTVGALAAAASLLPKPEATVPVAAAAPKAVDPAGGYQLTDHVKRYYQTARV